MWSLLPYEIRIFFIVFFVLLFLMFVYMIKIVFFAKKKPKGMNVRTWKQRREERNKRTDEWVRAYGLGNATVDTNALINKMKIILGLAQIVREFGTSLSQVPWPPIVLEIQEKYTLFFSFDVTAIFDLPGMNCLAPLTYLVRIVHVWIGTSLHRQTDTPFPSQDKFVITVTTPIMMCTTVYLIYRASLWSDTLFGAQFLGRANMIKIIIGILFVVHPSCCSATFQVLRCRDFENGDSYLYMDYEVQCNSDKPLPFMTAMIEDTWATFAQYRAYAWLMVLVYPVLVPYGFYTVLAREKALLYDKQEDGSWRINFVKEKELGFLYASYERRTFYWETVELLKKMFFVGVMLFIAPGTPMQLIVGSVAAVLMMIAYSTLDPYVDDADDSLQTFSQFTIFLSYFMAVLITMNTNTEENERMTDEQLRTQGIVTFLIVSCSLFPICGLFYFTFKILVMPYINLWWLYLKGRHKGSVLDEQETELGRVLLTNHVKTHQSKLRMFIKRAEHLPNAEDIVGSDAHHPAGANGAGGVYYCMVEWDGVEYDATKKQPPTSKDKDKNALHDQNTATVRVRVMIASGLKVPKAGMQPFIRATMIGNFDDPTGEHGTRQHKHTKMASFAEADADEMEAGEQEDWAWHEDFFFEVADIDSAKLQLDVMEPKDLSDTGGMLTRHLSLGSIVKRRNSAKKFQLSPSNSPRQTSPRSVRSSPPKGSVRSIRHQSKHGVKLSKQSSFSQSQRQLAGGSPHGGNRMLQGAATTLVGSTKFGSVEVDISDALKDPEPKWYNLMDLGGKHIKSKNGKHNARVSLMFSIASKIDTSAINTNFHSTTINWQKKLEYFLPPQNDEHQTILSFKVYYAPTAFSKERIPVGRFELKGTDLTEDALEEMAMDTKKFELTPFEEAVADEDAPEKDQEEEEEEETLFINDDTVGDTVVVSDSTKIVNKERKFFNVLDLHATIGIDFEVIKAKKVSKKQEMVAFVSGKDFKAIVARVAACSGTTMLDDLLPAYRLKLNIGNLQVAGFKDTIIQHSYSTLINWGNPRQKHYDVHTLMKTPFKNPKIIDNEAMVAFNKEVHCDVPQLLIKVYQRPEKLGGSSEALIEHNPSGVASTGVRAPAPACAIDHFRRIMTSWH
jgi:hypothetical protein